MTCVNTFLKMRKIKFLGKVHTRKLQNDDTIVDEEKYVIAQVTQAHECKYLFFGHRSLIRNKTLCERIFGRDRTTGTIL